jgi:hypothetical protein
MHTNIGLWIDHRRAVIVFPSRAEEETKVILSHADRQPGRSDGERSGESHESLQTVADDVRDRKFAHTLNGYYDEVIACVHGAASLLVLGPGEAKGEFVKRLWHEKPATRSVNVETTDKLTDRQIAARVRDHFTSETPIIVSK